MTTRLVTAPDDVEWRVRRRWIPHRDGKGIRERLRARKRIDHLSDVIDAMSLVDVVPGVGLIVAVVGVLAFALLAVFIFPPLILLGLDVLWLLVFGLIGLLARIGLRRPWRVEAVSESGRHDWFAQGFRAAGHLRDDLANQYRHGAHPHLSPAPELPH